MDGRPILVGRRIQHFANVVNPRIVSSLTLSKNLGRYGEHLSERTRSLAVRAYSSFISGAGWLLSRYDRVAGGCRGTISAKDGLAIDVARRFWKKPGRANESAC